MAPQQGDTPGKCRLRGQLIQRSLDPGDVRLGGGEPVADLGDDGLRRLAGERLVGQFAGVDVALLLRGGEVLGQPGPLGGDVGPDLAKISQAMDRVYILESIVDPNAKIAPGYDSVLLTLNSGDVILGVLNAEDADEVTVTNVADGKRQKIKVADIKERTHAPSPMPPGMGESPGSFNRS